MNLLVTITYNALKHDILDPFFDAIRRQESEDFALLVIDNASSDGTQDYLRALDIPNLHLLLNEENIGFGRACNQGIAIARKLGAHHVTFINNDVDFGPGLIGGMAQSLEASGAAGLSPLITPYDQPENIWFIKGRFRWERGIIPYHEWIWRPRNRAPADSIQPTDFATGCCLIFRMDVFDTIPGFDERFFVYWEDADLSMTLKEKGMPIIVDTRLVCRHKVSVSTGGSFSAFSVYHFNRGHMLFVRKHYPTVTLGFVIPVAFAKMALNVIRGRMKLKEIGSWFRGVVSGLRD